MVMCRACGEFVPAIRDGESLFPTKDECPECGGQVFSDNETDEIVRTAESPD